MAKTWRHWVGQSQFWLMGVVYMMARIAYNCLATIWPFYLQYVCLFTTDDPTTDPTSPQLAIVPLVNYLSSTIFSIFFQAWFTQKLQSRVKPIGFAAAMIICGSIPLAFISPHNALNSWAVKWLVYPCASI
jgi:Na+/melibiose symporter-like transporter